MYFVKSLLLYSQAFVRQTKSLVMMTKEGYTNIVTFMIPRAGVLVLWHGHIVKMQIFFSSCLHWDKLSIQ